LADVFVGPISAPPNDNAEIPVNTSSFSQVKAGGLSLGSLLVNGGSILQGNVGIGTLNPLVKLQVSSTSAVPLILERTTANSNVNLQFKNSTNS